MRVRRSGDEEAAATDGPSSLDGVRARLGEIVFGTATRAGQLFDVFLILSILLSVLAVMLMSVPSIRADYGAELMALEWGFTILFTVEYLLRLWIARSSRGYATSFFGVVDLLAILPTYLSLLLPGAEYLLVIRALRVLRVFRILKLLAYMDSATVLRDALWDSRQKIIVFFISVFTLVIVFGSLMYLIEGPPAGFTSIPISVYWAVVTMTTVGYGDLVPATAFGRSVATVIMLLGYAIIAVPTGIVTSALSRGDQTRNAPAAGTRTHDCGARGLRQEARFCDQCGEPL